MASIANHFFVPLNFILGWGLGSRAQAKNLHPAGALV